MLGLELHGKIFDHAANHIILQEAMKILENIENRGIGGFFGDEIQNGNGIALAYRNADIKAGGEIPADHPHIFQFGSTILYHRKQAFFLPGGDVHDSAAGADGKIKFFMEVHIFSPFGKESKTMIEFLRRGHKKPMNGSASSIVIFPAGTRRTGVSIKGRAAVDGFYEPKLRKLQKGKAQ